MSAFQADKNDPRLSQVFVILPLSAKKSNLLKALICCASPGKQNLTADFPIALEEVNYVLLADGTRLTVSAEGENP